jgi:uncharacterized protein YjbI with pentapeptide repeats
MTMANDDHLKIIRQGPDVWNRWRNENPGIEPDLARTDLSRLELNEIDLNETDLRKTIFQNTTFRGATLIKADLRGSNLQRASFNLANLSEANLSEAVLRESDFSEAILKRTYLIRADLVGAELFEADLERADFRWAFLIGSDLRRANLFRADLRWAYLIESNLSEADLSQANLSKAILSKTDVRRVNFRDAVMAWSSFGDIDLSMAKGLHTVKHFGPSTVGIDTIHRSKGQISEGFLKGAGVPQKFIAYVNSLSEEAFVHYSCFISCSNGDLDFAEKLRTDLQNNGIHCWYIPQEMKIGDNVQHNIEKSIRIHEKQILVLSKNSLTRQWVEKKIENANEKVLKKKKKRNILIPVRTDTAALESDQAWAVDLRNSGDILDFADWKKPGSYQKTLKQLLAVLKTDD